MKRKLSFLLLTLTLCFVLAAAVFAEATVTYQNHAFTVTPGGEYTETDLFENFKNVMPGDILEQKITILNKSGADKVRIYMKALAHDEENEPIAAGIEDRVEMIDFLKQLSMTVWQGRQALFQASPDQLEGLEDYVLLGTFRANESTELTVQLEVPADLGNEYANCIGEVDWVFLAEEIEVPYIPPVRPIRPDREPEPELEPIADPTEDGEVRMRLTLQAHKTVNGETPTDTFYFYLADENGEIIQTQPNMEENVVFDSIFYDHAGTYTYYLSEQIGSDVNMIYDETVYTLEVVIGAGTGSVAIWKNGEPYDGDLLFDNRRIEPEIEETEKTTEKTTEVPVEEAQEKAVGEPQGNPDSPQTGDDTQITPYVVMFVIGAIVLLVVLMPGKKKKNSEE